MGPLDGRAAESIHLPLPSALSVQRCRDDSLEWLAEQEMQLRTGQANDALHELCLALADKAVLFRTNIRHSSSQATANDDILARYQGLSKDHLKISGVVAELNARGHRNDTLPWSWSMDVARDAEANDWMMECKAVHSFLFPHADSPSLLSSLAPVKGFERSMGGRA
ncbi:hypothetical protein BDN67DRAFT_895006 [Paxillus ammoniavirescens]|nr:hypothetical protein BDN67DRAFT_895006 [Paxillus ammoniavirescens]